MRYFEDFTMGSTITLGTYEVSESEIIDFATRYDPQAFHIDARAANESPFGGLISSGWLTCAIFMRLFVTGLLANTASVGSPGVDAVRWPVPVRPGDTLDASIEVLEARVSKSSPERGVIRSQGTMANSQRDTVLSLTLVNFIARSHMRQ